MALKTCLKANILLILTVISAVMGVTIGLLFRQLHLSPDTILLISLPGDIVMRMLNMLILPLIVASMITGIANMDSNSSGKMGLFTMAYYISTTVIAICIGFALVFIIKPGLRDTPTSSGTQSEEFHAPSAVDMILDLIKNLFPDNIVSAAIQSSHTVYVKEEFVKKESPDEYVLQNVTNSTFLVESDGRNTTEERNPIWTPKTVTRPGFNVLGMLVYCAVFGAVLGKLGDKGRVVFKFFEELNEITMGIVHLVMWITPIGVLSLIAGKILSVSDLAGMVHHIGMFLATCMAGLFVQTIVVIPLIYLILTRKNPFMVTLGIVQALLTALGTNSSAATLPVTIDCCEKNLKIDRTISRFVLPIGATVNMDGAAIVLVVTPVYIAQISGVHLSVLDVMALGVAGTLTSIGTAGIPNAAIVTIMVFLANMGLPTNEIYIIFAMDWFLGRMRTITNVNGDCMGAAILQHFFHQDGSNGSAYENSPLPQDEREMEEV
ncbi:excitatory amino acid transporter 1-like [Haliotis rubra]|uniref:excitatory amino acid transporter 1-like n=1 Tax=Haliotis rubra TaxID=36100 RepID=UPI001EE530D7|nr:excitatory amino acid transporter 1-like [Haliotis rubra]